jgi:hypothetical protein
MSSVVARPLSSYFRCAATATINLVGERYATRIETDDGWYIEPPPADSLMEAIRNIRLWAGERYEVAVIEDLDNSELTPVPMSRKERGHGRVPREEVRKAAEAGQKVDRAADARRRMRRCA